MITSIEIQGLRGIRSGKIEELAPLTIFVGPNGCGKSTVLEGIGVACAGPSAELAVRALASREWLGIEGMRYWIDLAQGARISVHLGESDDTSASKMDMTPDMRLVRLRWSRGGVPDLGGGTYAESSMDEDGSISRTGHKPLLPFALQTISVDRPAGARGRFSTPRFSSALRDALTVIKLSPWYDSFLEYLKILRPNLQSIESIAVGDRDEPFMFEGSPRQGYPMAYAGDGFRRALLLASTLAQAKGGAAAMDEPEAFAHPRMFPALTRLIRKAIDDGTQVFFATHSLEFIAAVLEGFKDESEKVGVVGLTMDQGQLDPVFVSGPDAYTRVVEMSHDLRL